MRRLALFLIALLAWDLHCSEIQTPTLEASANLPTLTPGQTAQLTVTRRFIGGPVQNVSKSVQYTVEPRGRVVVVPDANSNVLDVTPGADTGIATVRITELDDPAITEIRFTVAASRIVSLHIDPGPAVVLAPAQTRNFTATATLSDLTQQDVTTTVTWATSNPAAAMVGNTIGTFGIVSAVAQGDATISATDTASGAQATALVLVRGTSPNLVAIAVTPNPASVGVGQTIALVAGGVSTDGTTSDLSKSAAWTTTNPAVATVDANGVVTGVATGAVTITAAGPGGDIKGSTSLTVQ